MNEGPGNAQQWRIWIVDSLIATTGRVYDIRQPGPNMLIQRPFSWTPACVSSTMISHAERVASWNDESQLVAQEK